MEFGGKIIIISETVPDYLSSPQYGTSCLVANDLLPDYQAVEMYINAGVSRLFIYKYMKF